MNIGYVRVTKSERNITRQVKAMADKGIEKFYIEKDSGKDKNRPQLQAMLDYVRKGDTVYIQDLSRLSRNYKDLLEIVELLESKGVTLHSNKEMIDSSTPTGKLILTMIGAMAEFKLVN